MQVYAIGIKHISNSIHPIWSESSQMPRLIWDFAGRKGEVIGFVVLRLIFFCRYEANLLWADIDETCSESSVSYTSCLTLICPVDLSILINWKSPFPNLGVSGVSFHFSSFSNRFLLTNSEDLYQTLHSAASDLGLHCLPVSQKTLEFKLRNNLGNFKLQLNVLISWWCLTCFAVFCNFWKRLLSSILTNHVNDSKDVPIIFEWAFG